jgi:hypothetical protein
MVLFSYFRKNNEELKNSAVQYATMGIKIAAIGYRGDSKSPLWGASVGCSGIINPRCSLQRKILEKFE